MIFVAQTIPAINPVAAMITANVKVVAPGEEKYITVPIINPLNNGEITILNHPMISVTDVSSLNIFKNYNKKRKECSVKGGGSPLQKIIRNNNFRMLPLQRLTYLIL